MQFPRRRWAAPVLGGPRSDTTGDEQGSHHQSACFRVDQVEAPDQTRRAGRDGQEIRLVAAMSFALDFVMVRQFRGAGHEPRKLWHGSSPIKQYTCLFMNQGAQAGPSPASAAPFLSDVASVSCICGEFSSQGSGFGQLRTTHRSRGGAARGGGTPCATSKAGRSAAWSGRTFFL